MRTELKPLSVLTLAALLATGCASAEKKLGRGLNNLTEPTRMGEFQRSVEKSYLEDGGDVAMGHGVVRGLHRTVTRTVVGAFEVATFPIPSGPLIRPVKPVYADSYKPRVIDVPNIKTSTHIGFDGADVAPFVPGSRFHIFD